jgi:hypothetical protein
VENFGEKKNLLSQQKIKYRIIQSLTLLLVVLVVVVVVVVVLAVVV